MAEDGIVPKHQRAVVITAAGGPEVLHLIPDWPIPTLCADEVLIKVVAAGIESAHLLIMFHTKRSQFGDAPPFDSVGKRRLKPCEFSASTPHLCADTIQPASPGRSVVRPAH
jgi:hypothetical protein